MLATDSWLFVLMCSYTHVCTLECLECPVGKFTDSTGQSSCKACEDGSFAPQNGTSSCALCDPGRFALKDTTLDVGASVCSHCGNGSFAADTGSGSCAPCDFGKFFSRTDDGVGVDECFECPPGFFTDKVLEFI